MQWLAIAAGGAGGAMLRFWMSTAVHDVLGRNFPWGTLAVNLLGSLLIGLLTVLMVERGSVAPEWRAAILIGLLGAFTTFSTFSFETLSLLQQGDLLKAALNAIGSLLLCLGATALGMITGRLL